MYVNKLSCRKISYFLERQVNQSFILFTVLGTSWRFPFVHIHTVITVYLSDVSFWRIIYIPVVDGMLFWLKKETERWYTFSMGCAFMVRSAPLLRGQKAIDQKIKFVVKGFVVLFYYDCWWKKSKWWLISEHRQKLRNIRNINDFDPEDVHVKGVSFIFIKQGFIIFIKTYTIKYIK